MKSDFFSPDECRLLEAWFEGRPYALDVDEVLESLGFDHDPCAAYTRLDAWVGALAVRDIQARLPNCGIARPDGTYVPTRPIDRKRRSKSIAGVARFLFRINWADSGPGLSWPADYHLVWLPGFERFVLTFSADSPDAFGYCDFALGWVGPKEDWRESVRDILVDDWRFQFNEWNQSPWAYVWGEGLVSEAEAIAWRREAWQGHEDIAPETALEEQGEDQDDG